MGSVSTAAAATNAVQQSTLPSQLSTAATAPDSNASAAVGCALQIDNTASYS